MKNTATFSRESVTFTLLPPLVLRNAEVAKIKNPIKRTDRFSC